MDIKQVYTTPFDDQRPGTSGLRKKTLDFMREHYLENFVQSVFDSLAEGRQEAFAERKLVLGGDGRFFNKTAIQRIIKMSVANGFREVLVGRGGVVSTPAVSAIIRAKQAFGGFVLSASHNPGGIDHDFGIKYNIQNGGPAPAQVTEAVFARTKTINLYLIADIPDVDLETISTYQFGHTTVRVIDPLEDYTALMQRLFDFNALSAFFARGFRMSFDGMHASTGPYARHILEHCLGAPEGTVINGLPLEDFGNGHPDPNQVHAKEVINLVNSRSELMLGAASDGDGDRNMIVGPQFFVTPGDSVAVIAEYAKECLPGYASGLAGVARSMPTSRALDRVAEKLGIPCYETPTGWKFFGNLMDAGKCTICGEESFGTGSNHVREKDGLWAVLCWISILAHTGASVQEVLEGHWERNGRSYFQREDYEELNSEAASKMISEMRDSMSSLIGKKIGGLTVLEADDFSYTDPIDGSLPEKQGIRLLLEQDSRVIFRLSGTGTTGATLRIYLESYRKDGGREHASRVLDPLSKDVRALLKLKERFGSDKPTVIT